MLVLHDPNDYDSLVTLLLDDSQWHVTHAYNGVDTLTIDIDANSKYRKYFQEEVDINFVGSRHRDCLFTVKDIDDHSDAVSVECEINLDEWKQKIFPEFRETYATLENILEIVTPDGWAYSGQEQFTKSTTIEGNEGEPLEAVTPLEVLDECTEAYGVVFNFDNVNRMLYCIDTDSYTPSGDFIMEDLNLKSLGFTGSTSNFATRLYAYGVKDEETGLPLTFASINNGKEYVEDVSYCDKIVCVGWSDERYTTEEGLLEAAQSKLDELSKPNRSYECDVSYLQGNIWLYKVVTLIDRRRGLRVNHQIVEWVERARQDLDSVTLSALPPSIESIVKGNASIDDKIDQAVGEVTDAYQEAIDHATDMITGSYGGYFKWVLDAEGNPMELVNLGDSTDINAAQKVWRWNKDGLGHSNNGYNGPYTLGLLADGSINASMMTVGIIQGGNSHWNLNSGDLSMVGEFATRSASEMEGTNDIYGVTISPAFTSYEVGGEDQMHGAGIQFTGYMANRYTLPFIMSEMHSNEEGNISGIVFYSGLLEQNGPGSWFRAGVRRNSNNEQQYGAVNINLSASDYRNGQANSDFARLYLFANEGNDGDASGFVGFDLKAQRKAGGSAGYVGLQGVLKDNEGSLENRLYLGGRIGYVTGLGTFALFSFGQATYGNFMRYTWNATVNSPAKYGSYEAFPSVVMNVGNDTSVTPSVYVTSQSASGASFVVKTLPERLMSSFSATWMKRTVGGVSNVVSDLNMNYGFSTLNTEVTGTANLLLVLK